MKKSFLASNFSCTDKKCEKIVSWRCFLPNILYVSISKIVCLRYFCSQFTRKLCFSNEINVLQVNIFWQKLIFSCIAPKNAHNYFNNMKIAHFFTNKTIVFETFHALCTKKNIIHIFFKHFYSRPGIFLQNINGIITS